MGKGMYARNSGRKTSRRESNSRYNFGAPRKLKLPRAEHAELSAVFLPGTIGRPPSPYVFPAPPVVPGTYAHGRSRRRRRSFFHTRRTAPFNIVGRGRNASGKSRSLCHRDLWHKMRTRSRFYRVTRTSFHKFAARARARAHARGASQALDRPAANSLLKVGSFPLSLSRKEQTERVYTYARKSRGNTPRGSSVLRSPRAVRACTKTSAEKRSSKSSEPLPGNTCVSASLNPYTDFLRPRESADSASRARAGGGGGSNFPRSQNRHRCHRRRRRRRRCLEIFTLVSL